MSETSLLEDYLFQIIKHIGEDPDREGLQETPKRIIRAWDEMFSGYSKNPSDVFKNFDSDGYDQIVLLKDIEFFSMCEHHMLPFFGKAHIAYLPGKRVIGISKLARLLDVFAKRMQIQERIGEQVTSSLMSHLDCQGAACIIEASHLCMRSRGIKKQNSVMMTSSMKGIFLTDKGARAELLQLIGG